MDEKEQKQYWSDERNGWVDGIQYPPTLFSESIARIERHKHGAFSTGMMQWLGITTDKEKRTEERE
jgi:hypothetical protein